MQLILVLFPVQHEYYGLQLWSPARISGMVQVIPDTTGPKQHHICHLMLNSWQRESTTGLLSNFWKILYTPFPQQK